MENFCKKIAKFFFTQNEFSGKFFFKFFLAIGVPQPIWGMPAKNWGV
jgi:hypothetical protein